MGLVALCGAAGGPGGKGKCASGARVNGRIVWVRSFPALRGAGGDSRTGAVIGIGLPALLHPGSGSNGRFATSASRGGSCGAKVVRESVEARRIHSLQLPIFLFKILEYKAEAAIKFSIGNLI